MHEQLVLEETGGRVQAGSQADHWAGPVQICSDAACGT